MRKINLSNGETYGTNNSEGGLFRQHSKTGEWNQIAGNSQTPYFKNSQAFYKWLVLNRKNWFQQFEKKPTISSAFGWE